MESQAARGFSYEVEILGDNTTVKCHGRIVADTANELKQLVKPMIPKCRRIVLDLSDVNFVDSSGLGTLVGLKVSAASAAYCTLEFVNLSPLVKELFNLTKLTNLLGT
jgi:anti-anti-sigma factor